MSLPTTNDYWREWAMKENESFEVDTLEDDWFNSKNDVLCRMLKKEIEDDR